MPLAAIPSVDSRPTPPPDPRRGAILLVEDRDDVREGLAQLLELHGYLVEDVPDGESAIRHLGADPDGFALLLLDLGLPGRVNGPAVRAHLLADERLAPIPTVVMTATELLETERSSLQVQGWLEKPFRFHELLDLVRRFVVCEGSALQAE